jgi:hypothetical protein
MKDPWRSLGRAVIFAIGSQSLNERSKSGREKVPLLLILSILTRDFTLQGNYLDFSE